MREYKGYIGKFEFDDEAEIFHGEIINIRDVITFQGKSVAELTKAFRDSIDDYLAFCAQRGEAPDKPFSGRFATRIPPELHRQINAAAVLAGKSLNAFVTEQLQVAVQKLGVTTVTATAIAKKVVGPKSKKAAKSKAAKSKAAKSKAAKSKAAKSKAAKAKAAKASSRRKKDIEQHT